MKLGHPWATYSKSDSQNEKSFLHLQSNFPSQDESQIQHFECHDYGQTSLGQTCQKCKWERPARLLFHINKAVLCSIKC